MDFTSLKLSPGLLRALQELGFQRMTPIQQRSIPLLLEGRDLTGQAKTGSGKTVAFALPILQSLQERFRLPRKKLHSVILCPTRELCAQVAREFRKLGRYCPGLHVEVISGGLPMHPQIRSLERGVHIVVGTPGRVLDHLKRGSLEFSHLSCLVLDEADRMLDMGFQDEMERIMSALPDKRQTVFFSATYPKAFEEMSRRWQERPALVEVEESPDTVADIRQVFYEITPDRRLESALWLLAQYRPESAIVFCNQKQTVDEVTRALTSFGHSAVGLHGDLEQRERDRVMAQFRNHSARILVATDVAARGIDVEALDAVINYELPAKPEVYVHRIGRTGRAGRKGLALSLGAPRDRSRLEGLEKKTERPIERKTAGTVTIDRGAFEGPGATRAEQTSAKMRTICIAGGRKEKVRPGDILGALTGEAGGFAASDIGKIEIHDHRSYVAVSREIAATAIERLRDGRIKGRRFHVELVK